MILDKWVETAYSLGASDLHLETDTSVVARIRGELQTVSGVVAAERLVQAGQDLLGAEGWAQFKVRGSADISITISGARCRANFFRTVRGIAIAIRLLAPSIKDLNACNLHPDLRKLIDAPTGLVIISGPTGSGKSTTLAALIEEIKASRAPNIAILGFPHGTSFGCAALRDPSSKLRREGNYSDGELQPAGQRAPVGGR